MIGSSIMKRDFEVYLGVVLTVAYLGLFAFYYCNSSQSFLDLKLNEAGDLFAGLFAPLAFLWMVMAILLQRKELSLQREELASTNEQLKRQSDVLETQLETSIMSRNRIEIEEDLLSLKDQLVAAQFINSTLDKSLEGKPHSANYFLQRAFPAVITSAMRDENVMQKRMKKYLIIKDFIEDLNHKAIISNQYKLIHECGFVNFATDYLGMLGSQLKEPKSHSFSNDK